MADTVKFEFSQVDEESGKRISYLYGEWIDNDRNTANKMSMSLIGSVVATVDGWRAEKAGETEEVPNGLIKSR